MEAVIKVPFKGVPDGKVYPKTFAIGDQITGNLARVAVEQGWAKEVGSSDASCSKSVSGTEGKTSGPRGNNRSPRKRAKPKSK